MNRGFKRYFALIAFIALSFSISGCMDLGLTSIPPDELIKKYGDAHSHSIQIGDVNLFYRDQGEGPVLLLIHGICASSLTWDGWVKELAPHYRVIRFDVPGFGISGPVKKELYDREAIVKFLDDFLNALKIDRVSIAGNSLGGYIAWNYALDHPERVQKLIVIDPLSYNQDFPWIVSFSINPVVKPVAKIVMPRFLIDMSVRQVYGDPSKITARTKDIYFDMAMREGNKKSYIDIFNTLKEKNKTETISNGIGRIKPPTLVMWGTKDRWIPFEYMANWKRDLPGARCIAYEGVGHVPMEEIPEVTARDAHQFLSSPE